MKYKGNVTIKCDDSVVVYSHNTGTLELSKLFSKMVAGETNLSSYIPKYIMPEYLLTASNGYNLNSRKPCIARKQIITGKHTDTVRETTDGSVVTITNHKAYFESVYSREDVSSSLTALKSKKYPLYLAMYNESDELLACVDVVDQNGNIVYAQNIFCKDNYRNVVVIWEMQLLIDDVGST